MKTFYRDELYNRFKDRFTSDSNLNRQLVSFQANKINPGYRWFKYKEGFSSNLVEYYLQKFNLNGCEVLDPYAGAGTTMFVSAELGCNATGIELLPVGIFVMEARQRIRNIIPDDFNSVRKTIWNAVELIKDEKQHIRHISITNGAFPEKTETLLNKYLEYCEKIGGDMGFILKFAAFCILEEISYTRKDGQYLRWDSQSGRSAGKKPFSKGRIYTFMEAIDRKLAEMYQDLLGANEDQPSLFKPIENPGKITIYQDSILTKLPQLEAMSFDFIITSPPYANRYDYTRTYALELIFLNNDNEKVKSLRQNMLSCTVENREKIEFLKSFYSSLNRLSEFETIINAYNENTALAEILEILEKQKKDGLLNNNGIVRLIRNYFLESCFTIYEMARVLKREGKIIMVNDNVRYGGEDVPVDLILSDFAEKFGLQTKNIFILKQNKGNSSQQMGNHGRKPLRKCIYLWQK